MPPALVQLAGVTFGELLKYTLYDVAPSTLFQFMVICPSLLSVETPPGAARAGTAGGAGCALTSVEVCTSLPAAGICSPSFPQDAINRVDKTNNAVISDLFNMFSLNIKHRGHTIL